jgi:hypothetical protein
MLFDNETGRLPVGMQLPAEMQLPVGIKLPERIFDPAENLYRRRCRF